MKYSTYYWVDDLIYNLSIYKVRVNVGLWNCNRLGNSQYLHVLHEEGECIQYITWSSVHFHLKCLVDWSEVKWSVHLWSAIEKQFMIGHEFTRQSHVCRGKLFLPSDHFLSSWWWWICHLAMAQLVENGNSFTLN